MRTTRRAFGTQLGAVAAGLTLSETLNPRTATAGASSDLSIDITGLCGFVHDRARSRTEVIFVDTSVFGSRIPRHTPVLIANLRDVMNPPDDSKPTTVIAVPSASGNGVEQVGLWDLTDQQVSIRRPGGAEAAGGLRLNAPEGGDAVPVGQPRDVNDPQQWRDLRYVVDMENLCGRGRAAPALLSQDASAETVVRTEVPQIVAARLQLAEGLLEAAIPSQEAHRGVMFEFPRTENRPAFSQPLTDTLSWRLSTDSVAMGNYVAIDIVPLRGGGRGREARTLLISQRGRPCRLSISNLPAENASHADAHQPMSHEEMGALHFGAYYRLLADQPAIKPLPMAAPEQWKGAGMIRNQFCAGARFIR